MSAARTGILVIAVLLALSFSVRAVSLQWSPLPYNIDGLSELRVVEIIQESGHLDFPADSSVADGYVSDMPLLGLLVAFLTSTLGLDPVASTQLMVSIVGAMVVSVFFVLFRGHLPSSKAALTGALSLALIGSFVFSTGCTWKETLGFLLLGLVLYSYTQREQLPYRALMTVCLPLLVFTHHHATIVAFVTLTFVVAIDLSNALRARKLSRDDQLDIVTVAGAWAVAVLYYGAIDLPYITYLSPQEDLYLYIAVAFLVLLLGIRLSTQSRPLTRLPIELLVPLAGLLIMAVNYFQPIFPGIPAPASAIAVPMLAYLVLVVPAWQGAGLMLSSKGPSKNLLLAMVLGPLSLILFGFLRSNDATSQLIIYRTFDFVVPAFALLIGVGFALLVKGRERLGALAGAALVVICASTLPIAYSSQELFGVENQTYWYEYDAVQWMSEHGVQSYTSDQRLGETGWRLFDLEFGRGLPYDLREGIALNGSAFFALETDWGTDGAQEFPFGVVLVDNATLEQALWESQVFYAGGPVGSQLISFRTR